jgi:quinol monooxygenase YgiN
MSQVVVVATARVKEGQREALLDAVRPLVEGTHAEAGCLSYALHDDPEDPGVLVFVERWTSQVALENHRVQPHVRDFGRAARDMFDGPPEIRVLRPLGIGDPAKGTL